jgi:hypothetical protein
VARARRGLGDVLHYFIPEEEQAEARARARPAVAAGPARWAIAADVARPLGGALVADLATAVARRGAPVEVIATAQPSPLSPVAAGVRWRVIERGADALARALADLPADRAALVALPFEALLAGARALPTGSLRGIVLPVGASPGAIMRALAAVRALAPLADGCEIGVLVVGAAASADSDGVYQRLRGAAQRQFGRRLLFLGELPRDAAAARSLLRGVPIVELDADAAAARGLAAAGARLASAARDAG